jgi:hypothetical protein
MEYRMFRFVFVTITALAFAASASAAGVGPTDISLTDEFTGETRYAIAFGHETTDGSVVVSVVCADDGRVAVAFGMGGIAAIGVKTPTYRLKVDNGSVYTITGDGVALGQDAVTFVEEFKSGKTALLEGVSDYDGDTVRGRAPLHGFSELYDQVIGASPCGK